MDLLKRRLTMLPKEEPYIVFADPVVEEFCANAFGDGVGLTKRRARKVTTDQFKTALAGFSDRTLISSFDEFRYFLHVTEAGLWQNCSALAYITLPKSCSVIWNNSFNGCAALERINLERIMMLRQQAFSGCSSLRIEINMPDLADVSGTVGLEYGTFQNSGITKVSNLGHVSNLGQYGFFQNCPNLTEVRVPKTVTRIGDLTFYQCPSLVTLILLPTNPPTLATTRAIGGATGRKIYVPYSSDHSILSAYKSAQNWSNFEDDIFELNQDGTVPDEV